MYRLFKYNQIELAGDGCIHYILNTIACDNVYHYRQLIGYFLHLPSSDSRGFLFGPLMALAVGKPFVPIRKVGKLPGKRKTTAQLGSVNYAKTNNLAVTRWRDWKYWHVDSWCDERLTHICVKLQIQNVAEILQFNKILKGKTSYLALIMRLFILTHIIIYHIIIYGTGTYCPALKAEIVLFREFSNISPVMTFSSLKCNPNNCFNEVQRMRIPINNSDPELNIFKHDQFKSS